MGSLKSGLRLRQASLADYDDVYAINSNVYNGWDYLPEIYIQWIADKSRDNLLILSEQNDVIGFFSLSHYTTGKYTIYVEQGLRLRDDVQGTSISKDVVAWIDGYAHSKSPNPLLLSLTVPFFAKEDYESKIEKYLAGSNTRTVLQVSLFISFSLTESVKAKLRKKTDNLCVVDVKQLYKHLSDLHFPGLKFNATYNGYIFKQRFYPFLINESFQLETLNPLSSPVLHHKSKIHILKSANVISLGDLTPVGTHGEWVINIDIYGEHQSEFMSHLRAHYMHFEQYGVTITDVLFHVPNIESIKQSEFYQEFKLLKTEKGIFTPTFVNQLKLFQ